MKNKMELVELINAGKVAVTHHAASRYIQRGSHNEVNDTLRSHILNELKDLKILRIITIKNNDVHLFTSYNREYVLKKVDDMWVVVTYLPVKNKDKQMKRIQRVKAMAE